MVVSNYLWHLIVLIDAKDPRRFVNCCAAQLGATACHLRPSIATTRGTLVGLEEDEDVVVLLGIFGVTKQSNNFQNHDMKMMHEEQVLLRA